MKHTEDKETMDSGDKLVVFKLSDMKEPIAGRYREFKDEGRFTNADYVYIHRGDGLILQKYSFGFEIIKEIEL